LHAPVIPVCLLCSDLTFAMNHSLQFYSAALLTGLAAVALVPQPARADSVGQKEIDQSSVVAIAVPYNHRRQYRLMLIEQLTSSKRCWKESGSLPVRIDPVLPNYDRAEMCRRSADVSDFSLRIAGQDLATTYDLKLVKQGNEIVLLGSPKSHGQSSNDALTIGRSKGMVSDGGFAKIFLNPGWRLAKQTVNGFVVGHTYVTTNAVLAANAPNPVQAGSPIRNSPDPAIGFAVPDGIAASPPPMPVAVSIPVPSPVSPPQTNPVNSLETKTYNVPSRAIGSGPREDTAPIKLAVPPPDNDFSETLVPVTATDPSPTLISSSSEAQNLGALPVPDSSIPPGNPGNQTDLIARVDQLPPPPSGSTDTDLGSSADPTSIAPISPSSVAIILPRFRVLVEAIDNNQKEQLQTIAPGAFRSLYKGRSMVQVGSFTDKFKAEEMMQMMSQNGFAPVLEQTP
jgi:Protein of unknown function (DUF3747)